MVHSRETVPEEGFETLLFPLLVFEVPRSRPRTNRKLVISYLVRDPQHVAPIKRGGNWTYPEEAAAEHCTPHVAVRRLIVGVRHRSVGRHPMSPYEGSRGLLRRQQLREQVEQRTRP